MTNLGDELRANAEKAAKAAATRAAKRRAKEAEEEREAIDKLWAEIEPTLEDTIRKNIRGNRGFYYPDFGEGHREWTSIEKSIVWKIQSWCRANGLYADIHHDDGAWDWYASDQLWISYQPPQRT